MYRICIGALLTCALAGCAGRLEDPSVFQSTEVCTLDVQQDILIPRCAIDGCHAPASAQAGLDLLTGDIGARLVQVESTTCLGQMRIDPQNIEASHLWVRLSPDPHCGDEPLERMPLLGEHLTEQEMQCVREWMIDLVEAER
jgi:hypothetical protein